MRAGSGGWRERSLHLIEHAFDDNADQQHYRGNRSPCYGLRMRMANLVGEINESNPDRDREDEHLPCRLFLEQESQTCDEHKDSQHCVVRVREQDEALRPDPDDIRRNQTLESYCAHRRQKEEYDGKTIDDLSRVGLSYSLSIQGNSPRLLNSKLKFLIKGLGKYYPPHPRMSNLEFLT